MSALKKLSPEMTDALGKNQGFVERYNALVKKSETQALQDDLEAINYIDDLIKRYQAIKATNPIKEDLKAKKEAYLPNLQRHVAELSILSFSKTGDLSSRLQEVGFSSDSINQIVKGIGQAGGPKDDLACLIITSALTETSLGICASESGHKPIHAGY